MVHKIFLIIAVALPLIGTLPVSHAHNYGGQMANSAGAVGSLPNIVPPFGVTNSSILLQSYFSYSENSGLLLAHIALMVVAWLFILPLGIPQSPR